MAGLFVPSWRDRRAVPQLARGTVSYLVGFLLLMNGCGSFKAGVGGMAHLGGGLVGAVLAGSGLLMVGMRSQGRTTRPGWRWIYRLAALGALGLTGTVVALAFAAGRPWELRQPALEQAWLPRSGVGLRVPVGLAGHPVHEPHPDEGWDRFVFGDGLRDPLIVSLIVRSLEAPVRAEALQAETAALLKPYAAPPPLGKGEIVWAAPPRLDSLAGGPVIFLDQQRGTIRLPRWVMLRGDRRIGLQVSIGPDAQAGWVALAPRIAASVTGPPAPRAEWSRATREGSGQAVPEGSGCMVHC